MLWRVLAIGLAAAISMVASVNQAHAQAVINAQPEPAFTTVTYPVADLVVPIDMDPGEKRRDAPTREGELMKLIRATVASKSWIENGGTATMQYHSVGLGLVVQQSPAAHQKIADLLKELRRLQELEVAVEIRLITVTDDLASKFEFCRDGGQVSDTQLLQFFKAAQEDRKMNIMQAPKLTAFNGQRAKINITEEFPYLARVNVGQAAGKVTVHPELESAVLGCRFQVRPLVAPDRTQVSLNLGVYLANLESPNVPLIPVTTLDANQKPVQNFVQLPNVKKIEVEKTLKIADGATAVVHLGRQATESRTEFSPPVLAKLPYLSRLFKNVAYGMEASELFAFVTARIIVPQQPPGSVGQ
jgi:Flp pilus assembly secretin CpaC